jgi:hypothetical protein
MPAWNSSSLAVSDSHTLTRHKGSGLLLNGVNRRSKQEMAGKQMFGSRRGSHGKDFKIGKKFRGVGKGIGRAGSMKSGGISPSVDEFDRMMSSVSGKSNNKKKMFSRKQFG